MADPGFQLKLDRRGMAALANSAVMGQAMSTAARRGADFIDREVSSFKNPTGSYAAGVQVQEVDVVVAGQKRKGARLAATSDHSQYVEWVNGTHLLARAVDAVEKGR